MRARPLFRLGPFFGYYRATTDIDILVPPTREQGKRVIEALLALPEKAGAQIDPLLSYFLAPGS